MQPGPASWKSVTSGEAAVVPIAPLLMTVLTPWLVMPAEPPKAPNGNAAPSATTGETAGQTNYSVRQTRLFVKTEAPTERGQFVTYVEGDFFASNDTTEFRIRHAFGEIGNTHKVLAGQTWSTFMDASVYPAIFDYQGPTAMVLVLLLMRDHPADVGLPAYGETAIVKPPKQDHSLGATLLAPLVTLKSVSGNAVFWVLFGTFFVCGLSTNGLIQTHWISICGDFGMAAVTAAGTLAVIGVFDFLGTVFAGWLSDRYDNRVLLFWFYGLRGLSLLYLSFSGFSFVELSVFAVFYGLDWVATVPPTVKLAAENFGREKAGMVFGWVFAGHQLGAATAAFGAGYLKSDFDTYMPALQIAGLACILAALSVMLLKRPGPAPLAATA